MILMLISMIYVKIKIIETDFPNLNNYFNFFIRIQMYTNILNLILTNPRNTL